VAQVYAVSADLSADGRRVDVALHALVAVLHQAGRAAAVAADCVSVVASVNAVIRGDIEEFAIATNLGALVCSGVRPPSAVEACLYLAVGGTSVEIGCIGVVAPLCTHVESVSTYLSAVVRAIEITTDA